MSASGSLVRITAVVQMDRHAGEDVVEMLRRDGCPWVYASNGRSSMLSDRSGLFAGLAIGRALEDTRVEVLSVLTQPAHEQAMLAAVAARFRLDRPGRGSVYSEAVELLGGGESAGVVQEFSPKGSAAVMREELTGICCIVQRGQGDAIVRAALEGAACVPHVTFGIGTGLRDKLGLLRVTVPAEKEVVSLVATTHDAPSVLNLLVDRGGLDQPGRGFVFTYPVIRGHINLRVRARATGHAASVDQIVAAIDELKGGAAWRSRMDAETQLFPLRPMLRDMVELVVLCDEGRGEELVDEAMAAGAGGATITQVRLCGPRHAAAHASPARESCGMVVAPASVQAVLAALEGAGLYDNHTHGVVLKRTVPVACTYLAGDSA